MGKFNFFNPIFIIFPLCYKIIKRVYTESVEVPQFWGFFENFSIETKIAFF